MDTLLKTLRGDIGPQEQFLPAQAVNEPCPKVSDLEVPLAAEEV